ncbi:MAG: glycosyltransferase family 2 protein [Sulfurimonadaceae bacterium]
MPNTQPLVSIPILTYNGEKYLREQLDSIFNQSYKNIEVLAFDDGSIDGTIDILEQYHKSHGLQYTINSTNLGFVKNAQCSLEACRGDFIAPSDQDDIWKPEKIEKLLEHIGDSVLIYADSSTMDEDGTKHDDNYFANRVNLIQGSNPKNFFFENSVSAHAMLFRKELLKHALPIPKAFNYHDWWIGFVAASFGKISLYPDPLVYYRRHSEQVTKHANDKNYSFWSRVKASETRFIKSRQELIERFQAFASLSILSQSNKTVLEDLIKEMRNYQNYLYNKKEEQLLTKHYKEFFYVSKSTPKKLKRRVRRLSSGIWYYRLKLYT